MKRLLIALGLAATILAAVGATHAQTPGEGAVGASITAVDASRFPEIHTYLAVQDAGGRHIPGLTPAAFSLTENENPVTEVSLLEAGVGIQVVFVLDVNAAFRTRDAAGASRLDYLREALLGYVQATMKDVDDLTLLTPEGELIAHVSAAAPVVDALNRYTTDYAGAADPLALLSAGLNFAGDVTPRPGMRRIMVVAANGLAPTTDAQALADLVARAQATQVQIHTVFVGPEEAQETVGAQNLRALSAPTGGLHTVLQGPAALQPILQSLVDQRMQYRLSYRSALNLTGQHRLAATVRLPDGAALTAPEFTFPLRVEPPIVSLPNLPAQIDLTTTAGDYPVPVQITFPDGHPRALQQAELLVDGQMVDRRAAAEVVALTWPLSGYTASLTRTVQVRLTDELGLSADSKLMEVFVAAPADFLAPTAAQQAEGPPEPGLLIAGLVAGLLIAVGLAAAWIWGRPLLAAALSTQAPPRAQPAEPARRPKAPIDPARLKDTMPLKLPPAPARRLHLPRVTVPRWKAAARAGSLLAVGRAYLEVVEPGGGGGAPQTLLELVGPVLRLGRDPGVAEAVFPDRSVSRLHARIAETRPGVFAIYDEGSTSGTWVNFTQVAADAGQELAPGDLINLGRVQLRFRLRDWPEKPPANGRGPGQPPAP